MNASKLKSRNLPAPPSVGEASSNLDAQPPSPTSQVTAVPQRIDGRSARRSNRTVQFATRVTPQFDDRIRAIAQRDGLLLVEVMEQALDAYEATKK